MKGRSDCAAMAQDPFQMEDLVEESFTLNAWVSLCI